MCTVPVTLGSPPVFGGPRAPHGLGVHVARRAQLRQAPPGGAHIVKVGALSESRELVRAAAAVVQDGGVLRGPPARRSSTGTTTAPATSAASPTSSTICNGSASTASGCCRSIRRRCATAATTSPTSTNQPGLRDGRRLPPFRRPGAPARHPRDRRPGHEPHELRASVVPGEPRGPDGRVRRLLRLGRRRHALERGAHHLPRHRAVELDVGPGARPVLLAPLLLAPAGPQLRQPGRAAEHARRAALLARPRPRRVPARRGAVPLRA